MRVSQSDVDGSHGVALLAACGGDEGMGNPWGEPCRTIFADEQREIDAAKV